MMTRNSIRTVLILSLCSLLSGCAALCGDNVPQGHVGMCKAPDGFDKKIYPPGRHLCFGPGHDMKLLEISERKYRHTLNVLCQDSLNLGVVITVVASINEKDGKLVRHLFSDITPSSHGTISGKQIYDKFAANVVNEEAKETVAQYATSEIVKSRKKIITQIQESIRKSLKDSVVSVRKVTINNMDFPKSVTKAQQRKAKQKVKIKTERARQKRKRIKARNRIKLAKLKYKKRLVEAATTADANRVIGDSISPEFLAWWQIKVMGKAAEGPNNFGFIPYSDQVNGQIQSIKNPGQAVMDEKLQEKINKLRKQGMGGVKSPSPESPGDSDVPSPAPNSSSK